MRRAAGREHRAQHLLGARLADRPGDRDDARLRPRARGSTQALHRLQRVVHRKHRAVGGEAGGAIARDHRRGRARIERRARHSRGRLGVSPLIAKKRSPGSSVRVSIETPPTARLSGALGIDRERRRRSAGSTAPSCRLPQCRPRLVRVAERQDPVADDLPEFHGPCRRSSAHRRQPASRRRRGSPKRDRRFRSRRARRRESAPRIAPAFSERGLSSVTITTSAERVAISPMIGRLPASRSPPQPKTRTMRPLTYGRSAAIAFSSASGLCA